MGKATTRLFEFLYKITPVGIKSRYLKALINDKDVWSFYDQLQIPGFGTNIVRFLFPIYSSASQNETDSISDENKATVIQYFADHESTFNKYLPTIYERIEIICNKYPFTEQSSLDPYIKNEFFGVVDASVLQAIIKIHQPKQYIEIGAGISTKYAKAIIREENLDTKIIAIDPFPRSEINQICDELITAPFETKFEYVIEKANPGDIVFLDGSHYVFPNNDTVMFFFQVLNKLPKGTIIHIHDIYLPFDYSENVKNQLWSENYLMLAWILGGAKSFIPLFPTYYLTRSGYFLDGKENLKKLLEKNGQEVKGFSFWLMKV